MKLLDRLVDFLKRCRRRSALAAVDGWHRHFEVDAPAHDCVPDLVVHKVRMMNRREWGYFKPCPMLRTLWVTHREDGPALEFDSGRKEWVRHNNRVRDDGPCSEMVPWRRGP